MAPPLPLAATNGLKTFPQPRAQPFNLPQMVKGEEGIDSWMDISAKDADEYIDLGEDYNWADGFDALVNYLQVRERAKRGEKKNR